MKLRSMVLAAIFVLAACGGGEADGEGAPDDFASVLASVSVPAEHGAGKALFDTNCASCHGAMALGTEQGPPLVHIYYEPSHHADVAFLMAAERGVRAHHWSFGDMPAVTAVNREDIAAITGYVRFLQRQVGID